MAFPVSPTNGQQVVVNGILYTYTAALQSWTRVQGVAGNITATGNISANNFISNSLITGTINANSTATVNALTSNGAISGTTGTFGSGIVTTTVNANANATVAGLTVNANATISGNITASSYIISGSGVFWSNGTAYSSGGGGGSAGNITGTGIFWPNGSPAVYNTSFWVQNQDYGFTANTVDYGNVLGLVTESVDTSYDNGSVLNGAAVAASNIIDFWDTSSSNYKVGFRNLPPVGTKTSSYTLAVGDVGKYVQVSTGGSITIPTTTFSEGDVVSIANNTTGNVTITCSAPTTYITGNNTVRTSVTLATRGLATVFFISNSICFIGGSVS